VTDIAVLGTVIDSSGAKKGARETTDALHGIGDQAQKSGKAWTDAHGKMRDSSGKFVAGVQKNQSSIGSAFDESTKKLAKLVAGYASFQALISSVRHIRDSTVAMESIVSGLTFVTGSAESAAKEVANLRAETDRLGLNFERTARGFIDVAAAARDTKLEGEGVREIFVGVSEAAAVLSLSQERVDRTFLALQQTISRGVLTMEEMGQLVEAIPGALGLAERAVGKFGAEFVSAVEKRMIDGKDFALAFARTMREDFAESVESSTTRSSASFARLRNAVFELSVAAGQSGLIDVMTLVAEGLTFWAKLAREAAIATGLLTVSVNQLNRSELESRLVAERERFAELEKGVAAYNEELDKIIETRKNLMAISGGDPSTYVPTIIDRDSAVVRSGFDIEGWRESRTEIERLERAIENAKKAEKEYGNVRTDVTGVVNKATGASKALKLALKEEATALRDVYREMARANSEMDRYDERSLQRMVDADADAARQIIAHRDDIEDDYRDLADTIGDVFVSMATTTSLSIEGIASGMARIFSGTISAMSRDAENTQLFNTLGAVGYGASAGVSIGGIPGLFGGAIGGGLGQAGGTALANIIGGSIGTAILPGLGTAIGAVLGGLVGRLFGSSNEPDIPQAYFGQYSAGSNPYGAGVNPQTVTPFGRFLVQLLDTGETPIPAEFMNTLNGIVEAMGVLDTAMSEALGPERTSEIASALQAVQDLGGGEIDEIQIQEIMHRRFEVIFAAIGGELESMFLSMSEGLDIGATADLALTLTNIFTSMEDGSRIFEDMATPVETVNALLDHFSRQNETLGETLDRLSVSMGLVTSLGLDHLEASTGFARFAEDFVTALGGMDAAIASTASFNQIFGSTQSGLYARGVAAGQRAESAFSAIGRGFSPADSPTLDEFNIAFMDVQSTLDAAGLARWVEAGLALAEFDAILQQLDQPVREVADALEEVAEAARDAESIARALAPLRQSAAERGLSDLEVDILRSSNATEALIENLIVLGANEEELSFARLEGRRVIEELILAENARTDAAGESARLEEMRSQQDADRRERERIADEVDRAAEEHARIVRDQDIRSLERLAEREQLAQQAQEAEAQRLSEIATIMASIADEQIVRTLSDAELALYRINTRYEETLRSIVELGASEQYLSIVRAEHTEALAQLARAEEQVLAVEQERAKQEAERLAQEAEVSEQGRLGSIAAIMRDIARGAEEMGLSDLEAAILGIRRETQATVAALSDLEASGADVARAIEYGERRIWEARKNALERELAAIEGIGRAIDDSLSGFIESIRFSLRGDNQNYAELRERAEGLAETLGTLTDPARIDETVREIERLSRQAWGMLDPSQQQGMGSQFIDFLENVREISANQLEQARDQAAIRAGIDETFATALSEAGPMFSDAARSFREDAETIGGAASDFKAAVDKFALTTARPIRLSLSGTGSGVVNGA